MMALLFAALSLASVMLILRKRKWTFVFVCLGILCSILMLWHHATDTLQINW